MSFDWYCIEAFIFSLRTRRFHVVKLLIRHTCIEGLCKYINLGICSLVCQNFSHLEEFLDLVATNTTEALVTKETLFSVAMHCDYLEKQKRFELLDTLIQMRISSVNLPYEISEFLFAISYRGNDDATENETVVMSDKSTRNEELIEYFLKKQFNGDTTLVAYLMKNHPLSLSWILTAYICQGTERILEMILSQCKDMKEISCPIEENFLQLAIAKRQERKARLLVEYGAVADVRNVLQKYLICSSVLTLPDPNSFLEFLFDHGNMLLATFLEKNSKNTC